MTGKLEGRIGMRGREWIQINEAYANILLPLKLKERNRVMFHLDMPTQNGIPMGSIDNILLTDIFLEYLIPDSSQPFY